MFLIKQCHSGAFSVVTFCFVKMVFTSSFHLFLDTWCIIIIGGAFIHRITATRLHLFLLLWSTLFIVSGHFMIIINSK